MPTVSSVRADVLAPAQSSGCKLIHLFSYSPLSQRERESGTESAPVGFLKRKALEDKGRRR